MALTPPYFHSGSIWDLKDAVGILGTAQLGEGLDDTQVTQIVAFLDSLTGKQPQVVYPVLPPSTADTPRPRA